MTFADSLRAAARRLGLALPPPDHPEPLAHLDYATELRLKGDAMRAFWQHHRLRGRLDPVTAAPQPRGYRTTSKRRAIATRSGLALAFSGDRRAQAGVAASHLDPPEHMAVYAHLLAQLDRAPSAALVSHLNYAIVRGSPGALCVILNLRRFDGGLVRRAKQIGRSLEDAALGVRSAFLYLDPTDSDYYLEARRPAGVLSFKRLFGPEWLELRVAGSRFRFPPVVFSQVNQAMLPLLVTTAGELLGPLAGRRLLDLYCGYGLFSLCLGGQAAQSVGVDAEGPAIQAARQNAERAGLGPRARFLAGRVTAELVASRLPAPGPGPEVVLLDPPRLGVAPGVQEALARRRPERILHVFCGTDEIPRELDAWRRAGYGVTAAVPLDLFPGSANLETLALLGPDGPGPRPRAT